MIEHTATAIPTAIHRRLGIGNLDDVVEVVGLLFAIAISLMLYSTVDKYVAGWFNEYICTPVDRKTYKQKDDIAAKAMGRTILL